MELPRKSQILTIFNFHMILTAGTKYFRIFQNVLRHCKMPTTKLTKQGTSSSFLGLHKRFDEYEKIRPQLIGIQSKID